MPSTVKRESKLCIAWFSTYLWDIFTWDHLVVKHSDFIQHHTLLEIGDSNMYTTWFCRTKLSYWCPKLVILRLLNLLLFLLTLPSSHSPETWRLIFDASSPIKHVSDPQNKNKNKEEQKTNNKKERLLKLIKLF